jgi:hypothetical protein
MTAPGAPQRGLRLPWSLLLAAAFAVVAVAMFYDTTMVDADLWWHLAYGRYCVEHRALSVDHAAFSWTDTSATWVYVSWLGDIVFYLVHRVGGTAALRCLQVLAYAGIGVLFWRGRRDGDQRVWPTALLMALAAALVMEPYAVLLKNSLFSAVLCSSVLAVYLNARRGRGDRFWIWPLLFLAWVNSHGEVLLGTILLALLTGGELLLWWLGRPSSLTAASRRRLLLGAGLSLVALACTPEGLRLPFYWLGRLTGGGPPVAGAGTLLDVVHYYTYLGADGPQEWPRAMTAWLWLAMTIALGAVLLDGIRRHRWADLPLALAAAAFVAASWLVSRLIMLAPLVWLFALSTTLDRNAICSRPQIRRAALALVAVLCVGCFAAKIFIYFEADFGRDRLCSSQPVAAARFVAEQDLPGPLFNDYLSGGYLIWALGPERPVYIDPRFTPYPPEFRAEYFRFHRQPSAAGLAALAAAHPFQTAVINNVESGKLAAVFATDPTWTQVFLDPAASVFVRTDRLTPALAAMARVAVDADLFAGETDLRTLLGLVAIASVTSPDQALRLYRTLQHNVPKNKLLKRTVMTKIERYFEATVFAAGGGAAGQRLSAAQVQQRFMRHCLNGEFDAARLVATGYLVAYPTDATMQYNLACVESRVGDLRTARVALAAALTAGYDQYDRILADKDLDALRAAPGFTELIEQHRSRAVARAAG